MLFFKLYVLKVLKVI